ncbi:type VI secretion system lipoprotein TssJ [Glaciimonas sp. GS1]|uniref:Type VI secretion system lipoprotein TssJ n=2 Tax=Glaciimonas soli TaxID=2590999 RepID=A0A843YRD1_9BURK|nr:type VI secretion system lipoprotein TssJ [Glaciimonas soli]
MFNAISRRMALPLSIVFATVLLSACASNSGIPAPKELSKLDLTIHASDDVNLTEKRATPVMVRIYELKSDKAFQDADYFSLKDNDKTKLGEDLLVKNEYILRPGDSQTIVRKSSPDTVAIGVLAGYQDLSHSVWRVVYKLPKAPDVAWYRAVIPDNKVKLLITLESDAIKVTEAK